MYLQTTAAKGCSRTFPTAFALMVMLLTASAAPAQIAPAPQTNVAAINLEGSRWMAGVNFVGSAQPAEVNPSGSSSSSSLPDAPSAQIQQETLKAATQDAQNAKEQGTPRVAPVHMKFIPAGWTAQPLTSRDKVVLGARNLYAPFSIIGYFASSGYSHMVNGQPNYGTNSSAYAKRLGAAVVRDTTEGAFTDMVFAPLLHEDPRYYVEGRRHGYVHRVLYAMTRPLITKTDSGRTTVNGALLLGQASASALSYTYYPQINRNFHDTAATFGGSLAGSAIDDVISEFSGQFLKELHLRRPK